MSDSEQENLIQVQEPSIHVEAQEITIGAIEAVQVQALCPICQKEMSTDANFVVTKCGHSFHLSCYIKKNKKCPTCKPKITLFSIPTKPERRRRRVPSPPTTPPKNRRYRFRDRTPPRNRRNRHRNQSPRTRDGTPPRRRQRSPSPKGTLELFL